MDFMARRYEQLDAEREMMGEGRRSAGALVLPIGLSLGVFLIVAAAPFYPVRLQAVAIGGTGLAILAIVACAAWRGDRGRP